ncbi:lanthionine synthetase C family protein [Frankia sp. KB5]|uniref:lanthionine synthetase C family protein n=1 Tax=Frankia sp. KB5 TaxID=683318 RepID=UPI000A114763|nr:lanthionine synthetase C family protein [Frankia sp. KB5]ORT46827.1 lanthionine synthetase [Frankia sp. KB5]
MTSTPLTAGRDEYGHTAGRLALGLAEPSADGSVGQSLSAGAAGIALLHIERAWAEADNWRSAHRHLTAATRDPLHDHHTAGLYFGAPAVTFALHAANGSTDRYRDALAALDPAVTRLAHQCAGQALERISAGQIAGDFAEYDVFSGLTGLGALLLRRAPHSTATERVLTALVAIASLPIADGHDILPGWWVSHDPRRGQSAAFPGGHANLGAAHGIASVLAVLAHAARADVVVDGQHDALATICDWLDRWRVEGPAGPFWPHHISRRELAAGRPDQSQPGRAGWCYGTPGIARAGQLAALALDDPARRADYESALAACLDDPVQLGRLIDPSLCHGWAGLVQTVWRAAADEPSGTLRTRLPDLAGRLATATAKPYPRGPAGRGLLLGQAGAALALHTVSTDHAPLSGWDACLLIT